MAGDWTSTGSHYISYTPGDFAGNGAFTLACLAFPDAGGMRLMSWFASANEEGGMLIDNGTGRPLYGNDDFSSGYGTTTSAWYVFALSKPAGNQKYRGHIWLYASDGSGTMSHGEATGAGNHANYATATACRLGYASGIGGAGSIAVAAYWDRVLSDSELDTLKSPNLSAWAALSPDLGVELSAWNGSSGAVRFAGSAGTPTLTGTVASGTNPTGFNFSLGGGSVSATAAGTQAGTGTAVASVTHPATAAGTQAGTGTAVASVSHAATAAATQSGTGAAAATRSTFATATGAGAGTGSAAATVDHPATAVGTQAGTGSATATSSPPSGGSVSATATGTQAGTGAAAATVDHPATGVGTQAGTAAATALLEVLAVAAATQAGTALAVAGVEIFATAVGTQAGTGSAVEANYSNPYARVPVPTAADRVPIGAADTRVPVDPAGDRVPSI